MKALVLLGHGARDPGWAGPLMQTRAMLELLRPDLVVEPAFLEFTKPSLEEAVAALNARGAAQIVIVPVFFGRGGHLKHDLPARLDALRLQYPDCALQLGASAGEAPEVLAAIAAHAAKQALQES
jgi:sirohydrochlorin cobaltochelatase